jgi:amino acid adenylation domain-containing protein
METVGMLRGARVAVDVPFGLPGLFRAQARRTPDRPACLDEHRALSYAELDALSDDLAAALTRVAAGRRGAVVLYLPRGVGLLVAMLGVLKAGCWYLPIDLDEPEPRIGSMTAVTSPVAVIAGAGAPPLPAPLGALTEVALPTSVPDGAAPGPLTAVRPQDPAYVMFTSGSTGRPKGVLVGSEALCNRILWMAREYRFGPDDVVLQKTPYTFDVSGWELFCPVVTGGCCVFAPPDAHRDQAAVADLIARHSVTICHFVPSVLAELLSRVAVSRLKSLRLVVCSGEALRAALAAQAREALPGELCNLYGPTEAAIDVTAWRVPEAFTADGTVLIGGPIDNTDLLVMDEQGRPVTPGQPGELWIGGMPVALGYAGDASLTVAAFPVAGGRRYYRTGDLVVSAGSGLRYIGRRDEQVKVRGVRVELGEIEQALSAHPAVRQAAIVALGEGAGLEIAAALTAADPDLASSPPRPSASELRAFLRARLPPSYLPAAFHWLPMLPLGRTGKIDRGALRALLAAFPPPLRDVGSSGDAVERLWRQALSHDDNGDPDAGFIDLGGHSLAAARLRAELAEQLGVEVPLELLLRDNVPLTALRTFVRTAVRRPERGSARSPSGAPGLEPDGTSPVPLSAEQRGVWLTCQLFPRSAAYNVAGALRLQGSLDVGALRAAAGDLTRRHDALRLRLTESEPRRPMLVPEPAAEPPLAVTLTDAGLTGASISRFAEAACGLPVRPEEGALWRLEVLTGNQESCVALTLHHLIADQHTLDLLLRDLAVAYAARRDGHAAWSDQAPSFASCLRRLAADGWPAGDKEYWRRALAGAPATLNLPFRQTAVPRTLRGTIRSVRLGRRRSAAIDEFRRARGLTPAMLFLGVFALVLRAWTGQPTLVVGVPASRRGSAVDQQTAGFLVATMPVRLDIPGGQPVEALLAHVRDRHVQALSHAGLPFPAIAEAAGRRTHSDGSPLFQAWFNDLTGAAPAPAFAGLRSSTVQLPALGALFDLNLYLRRGTSGYQLELVVSADRVPGEVASELLAQCVRALDQVLVTPGIAADALDLADRRDARHRAGVWRDIEGGPPAASATPTMPRPSLHRPRTSRVAVRGPADQLTYAELDEAVNELAGQMNRAGAVPGDLVEIRAHRSSSLPVALLATWRVGAVAALVDASWPAGRVRRCGELLRPDWILEPALGLGLGRETSQEGNVGAQRRMSAALQPGAGAVGRDRLPDGSHVLLTSGSTGGPATVLVRRGALERGLAWYKRTFAPGRADRVAMLAGLSHDPLLRDILVPLCNGGELVVPDDAVLGRPDLLLSFLADEEITILHATPALLELLTAASAGRPARKLRLVVSGGAPLTAGLVRQVRRMTGAEVVNVYGSTETPQVAAYHRVLGRDEPATRLAGLAEQAILPVGRGVAGYRVSVRTPAGRRAAVGQRGEIFISRRALGTQYLAGGRDSAFAADPDDSRAQAFRTGDLGRLDPWGNVYVDGRVDRQVQVDGFRIALEEVEEAALSYPGVRQVVAGLTATLVGQMLTLEVAAPDGTVTEGALRAHLRGLLTRQAVPSSIRVVARLGTNSNHKVELGAPGDPRSAASGPDLAKTPRWVASLVRDILGREVDPAENLFEAGLTSVGLLRLHAALADAVPGLSDPIELFACPNLLAIGQWLLDTSEAPAALALARRPQRRGSADPEVVARAARSRRSGRPRPEAGA